MRVSKSGAVLAAVTLSFGLVAVACGDSGDKPDGVTVHTVKPENPLIPGGTTEVGGGRIIESLFTGLNDYDTKTGEPVLSAAKSIETSDNQTYTVTLNEGWEFHDGTPLKAKNFVDAWNFTAYTPNAQQSASFMSVIEGYDQVHTIDPDQDGPQQAPAPETDKMSGLEVVSDTEFTITLTNPNSVFNSMLAYSAFQPLPDMFYTDRESYEAKPIGNGPFKVVKQDTKGVEMERYEDYQGDKAKVEKLTWKYYTNDLTAYRDIQNDKLDFIDQIPLSRLTQYEKDFDKDHRSNKSVASIDIINFPVTDPKYSDVRVRQAISMAVNSEEIAETVFHGAREPADGFVNPSIPGYKEGQCGEACDYDPAKAKALLDEAGGFKGDKMEIWYNSDGPHKEWIEAVCGSIQDALDVPCEAQPSENFADIRARANAQEFDQMYRAGWQADYPSIENYLNPLYRTGGSSNDAGYSNPEVDAKLAEADKAPTMEEANVLFQEAERLVAADMPGMPVVFRNQQSVWSDNIENVEIDWRGELVVTTVELK